MSHHGQQCRQQRHACNHHGCHTNRHCDCKSTHEFQADGEQSKKRDDDSEARKDHCTARSVDCFKNRIFNISPIVSGFTESSDNKQCVVNTHSNANHCNHRRCRIRHADDVAGDGDDAGRNRESKQCDANWQSHCKNRSECKNQNDDRCKET